MPLSVAIFGAIPALVLMLGTRYAWRLLHESQLRPQSDSAIRTLVFGAGEAAAQVITAMQRDPRSPYVPVALLDDDPRKRNRQILGVRVVGTRNDVTRGPPSASTPRSCSSRSPRPTRR